PAPGMAMSARDTSGARHRTGPHQAWRCPPETRPVSGTGPVRTRHGDVRPGPVRCQAPDRSARGVAVRGKMRAADEGDPHPRGRRAGGAALRDPGLDRGEPAPGAAPDLVEGA